jgi:16S rRNA U516 pseudouridylate synthase RsuA-like enzyme
MSDDGDFVYKVTHPSQSMGKTYLVTVKGKPDANAVTRIKRG